MARLPRVDLVGVAQHVVQRGNNKQICFAAEQDFSAYLNWLKEYSVKFDVDIHAWVLMTNHVHLLCTPNKVKAVSNMMQGLGRQYIRYFNYAYKRTGTLWEGRFKSCLVQADDYLLQVYRYIELNPVRASMVDDPGNYFWSSYQINGLGKKSELCSAHPTYLALAKTPELRRQAYRDLFKHSIGGKLLEDIRSLVNKGMALGHDRFKDEVEVEALSGCRVKEKKRVRPEGWRKNSI